jgi:hypothetical protein
MRHYIVVKEAELLTFTQAGTFVTAVKFEEITKRLHLH